MPSRSVRAVCLTGLALVAACQIPLAAEPGRLPPLPVAVANNAVAVVQRDDGPWLLSFLGLGEGRTHADITRAAFVLPPGATGWQELPAAPGPGRLAATAIALGETVYLFGGYTVADDGSEKSIETVHALDLAKPGYRSLPPMPVPVDDAVSAVYDQRYVYLVSGWHDTGNVNLVQVLDTLENRWFQATPYPGKPVFGHAGAIAGDVLVICDGVGIVTTSGKRQFAAVQACYRGQIDPQNPASIDWTVLPNHPGPALYRMAAAGVEGKIVFAGGSDNPYNYNGIGYDGRPSSPSDSVFYFAVAEGAWHRAAPLARASMDHRGLLALGGGRFAIVGGMHAEQRVVADVAVFSLGGASR